MPAPLPQLNEATLTGLLQHIGFPIRRDALMQRCPEVEMMWSAQEPIFLRDIIADLPQAHFDSLTDLLASMMSSLRLAYGDYSVENQAAILRPGQPTSGK